MQTDAIIKFNKLDNDNVIVKILRPTDIDSDPDLMDYAKLEYGNWYLLDVNNS